MPNHTNPYEAKIVADVLSELKVLASNGLYDEDVKQRQTTYGFNEVVEKKQLLVLLFLKHFWGLTAIMLEITIVLSFLLQKYVDVYLIGGLMLFNAIIGFIQESKAAKTVQALKQSLQVLVRVLRNNKWQQVLASQLVPGDIIRVRTGDFMTADAKIIDGFSGADQSALTGESLLISKKEGDMLFSGSVIKNGFILGSLLIAEALGWLFIGKNYFEMNDINQLHSFGFATLFFASIFNIFVVRTPTRFYKQQIGKTLLLAIIADIILACVILSVGLPGFTILPILVTSSSILYFAFCSLIINDWVKLRVKYLRFGNLKFRCY